MKIAINPIPIAQEWRVLRRRHPSSHAGSEWIDVSTWRNENGAVRAAERIARDHGVDRVTIEHVARYAIEGAE